MLNTAKSMIDYQYSKNSQLAQDNRDWQERLANSAHQREISDLKKAGLNPVLSVTGGSGANTPSGASASVGDGAGYMAALANLETAKINSATQMYMHDTPSANSWVGAAEYLWQAITGLDFGTTGGALGAAFGINNGFLDNHNYNSALSWYKDMFPGAYGRISKGVNAVGNLAGKYMNFLSGAHEKASSNGKLGLSRSISKMYDDMAFLFPRQHYKNSKGMSTPYAGLIFEKPFKTKYEYNKSRREYYRNTRKIKNRLDTSLYNMRYRDNTRKSGYYYHLSNYKDSKPFNKDITRRFKF